jgi:hypothetical protein
MEFLLLWLDELDDCLSTALLCWRTVRWMWLLAGLIAAILLHAGRLGLGMAVPALLLAVISGSCVLVWSAMTLTERCLNRRMVATT